MISAKNRLDFEHQIKAIWDNYLLQDSTSQATRDELWGDIKIAIKSFWPTVPGGSVFVALKRDSSLGPRIKSARVACFAVARIDTPSRCSGFEAELDIFPVAIEAKGGHVVYRTILDPAKVGFWGQSKFVDPIGDILIEEARRLGLQTSELAKMCDNDVDKLIEVCRAGGTWHD